MYNKARTYSFKKTSTIYFLFKLDKISIDMTTLSQNIKLHKYRILK